MQPTSAILPGVDASTRRFADQNCSVARTLGIVGERWTLLVLREAFLGVRRFDRMQADLSIARNILADRLQSLVETGILERRRYQDHPPRSEYRLTQKGLDLYPILVSLMRWGDQYESAGGPPVVLTHRACGHAMTPVLACPHCGDEITARDVTFAPGPGSAPGTHPDVVAAASFRPA